MEILDWNDEVWDCNYTVVHLLGEGKDRGRGTGQEERE